MQQCIDHGEGKIKEIGLLLKLKGMKRKKKKKIKINKEKEKWKIWKRMIIIRLI